MGNIPYNFQGENLFSPPTLVIVQKRVPQPVSQADTVTLHQANTAFKILN